MFISYMFRPARAILSYEELYKNTRIDLHDPVNNWDVSFCIWLNKNICINSFLKFIFGVTRQSFRYRVVYL
jgi:hypothetical protein